MSLHSMLYDTSLYQQNNLSPQNINLRPPQIFHIPKFYNEHKDELEKVFSLLSDDESRMIFAARIRSVITGNLCYIKLSGYAQYFHPETIPQKDDIIIDGGVSHDTSVEEKFSILVGNNGRIYSFEPDPTCYYQASEKISTIKNITLIPLGLSNKSECVDFISDGYASRIAETPPFYNTITCQMTTIDTVVSQYNIENVDIIKLDVEKSELKALLGGVSAISKFKPKLIICIYHRLNDVFELPLFINDFGLNYKFYIGHHSPTLWETVLYAKI